MLAYSPARNRSRSTERFEPRASGCGSQLESPIIVIAVAAFSSSSWRNRRIFEGSGRDHTPDTPYSSPRRHRQQPTRLNAKFSLFVGQAFLYNAFFFTYGDTLTTFLGVGQTGWYLAVFAVSNFAGALLLSPLFDSVGRVRMITATYVGSGVLLGGTGLFLGHFSAVTLTLMGAIVFFIASAGASAAYLTASEVFPMETRALCIAFFYAIGTAAGGISGPLFFGWLIDRATDSGDISRIALGYLVGAVLMIGGGVVEAFLGVSAEGRSLEDIAQPLTAADADDETGTDPGPGRSGPRPTPAPA